MTDIQPPAAVHAATLTLDTHVDIPWPETPDPRGETNRCVDFPKMRAGGLRAVVFAAYLPQGPRTPEGHAAAARRCEAMLRAIRATAGGEDRRIVSRAAELETLRESGKFGVMLAVENGYGMGEDLSRLALWRGLGACYVTLTHNGHNLLADSAIPRPDLGDGPVLHGGLSSLGREAVAEMNALGLLVDVSHVAKSAMLQAVEISRAPVVATHACVRALRDHPRNLDDTQMDALRASGGLMQITAVPGFLRGPGPDGKVRARVADIADHVDYAVQRIGIAHVGLSSDFDGGGGVEGWMSAADSANLTAELLRRGYDAEAVGLLWSGNFLRVMRAAEAVSAAG
ncbi:diguanylate cyclase [Pseudoroseomonas rhizosphaerae]|uniref:Diguanylate cyclase n=1 Tax=Teichococcus rhizosphaerae TaxID=1335062 RepID=A0A2C7AIJ6_9PROT|nr:dipeptidase [Pseudoroseomonas rhizosphaerae]PHK96984.1 diguanylate cyclase [Pseudoroseomonas rhizosphaerae]